jgi:hypothetical protein
MSRDELAAQRGLTIPDLCKLAYDTNRGGLSFPLIAQDWGTTRGTVARLVYDWRHKYAPAPDVSHAAQGEDGKHDRVSHKREGVSTGFSVKSEEYRGELPTRAVPRFTGAWHLTGDFLVLNDVHIPATNWAFANKAVEIAKDYLPRPRQCIIVGDLINGDALSRWDDLVLCTPLSDELEYARAWLRHMAQHFDTIHLLRGNHENRLLLSLRGQLHADQFRRMVADNDRVQFSMYSWCRVTSGGQMWYLAHQRNYSKNPLSVARRLAERHHTNIITAHQHHSAVGRDPSNQHTLIDSGGLHDSRLMAYVQLDSNTSPAMNNGFVLLKNGVGTLFTPPQYNMMDWTRWEQETAAV